MRTLLSDDLNTNVCGTKNFFERVSEFFDYHPTNTRQIDRHPRLQRRRVLYSFLVLVLIHH